MPVPVDGIVQHIRIILADQDVMTIQYLIPAFKLFRCWFAEHPTEPVNKEELELISDTIQYLINYYENGGVDKRLISEASLLVANTICDIEDSPLFHFHNTQIFNRTMNPSAVF